MTEQGKSQLTTHINKILKMILVIMPIVSGLIVSIGVKKQVITNFTSLNNLIYITLGICIFFVVFYGSLLPRKEFKTTRTFLTNLIFITITILGIHFSGGLESPLYYILLIYLLIFSISSNGSSFTIPITIISCCLYTSFVLFAHFNIIPYVPFSYGEHGEIIILSWNNQILLLVIRNSLLFIAGLIPNYLIKNLSKEHRNFLEAYDNLQKQEHLLIQAEKMSSLGELTSGISHEIKNQLTSISIFAQLAYDLLEQKKPPSEDLKDFMKTISQSTQNSINYLTDLLKFSRGSTLDEEDKLIPLNINEIITSATNLISHQFIINKIKIEKNLSQTLPLVKVNRAQLEQVFLNLIINAKDALSQKKGEGKLTINSSVTPEGHVLISFTDNGRGIAKENFKRIFEPFFSTKEKGKGTGLGLPVTKRLMKYMGGKIHVESQENVGTTFYVMLPSLRFKELFSEELKKEDTPKSIFNP